MYLNQEKRLITLNELSKNLGISKNNLIQVSNRLAKLDFIETTRGRAGGLIIKKETGAKTIKEIILQTEENFYLAECFSTKRCDCTFLKTCLLRKSLKEALEAFFDSLSGKSLDDVTLKKPLT
jgi:Rrf2 family nitric oxide-sensitive transcriptional repressor